MDNYFYLPEMENMRRSQMVDLKKKMIFFNIFCAVRDLILQAGYLFYIDYMNLIPSAT